ncbi:MAG TPA: tetraacyldisaccharide 4'-kinase [Flavobacteriaceae bacterium]|nr:tetraacyldisaccharide 4'-kinase [Flavobacteriaceae bacterium]
MKSLRKLLLPFSVLYGLVTAVRNKLFDFGILKSTRFSLPVIVVGNLSTGGTGKSPMVEYLIRNLKNDYKIGVVSRGYGRKTKGFLEVLPSNTAMEVGDEPLQIKKKFPEVIVAVSEKRAVGIEKIRKNTGVILLDDAFQHRSVKPGYSILLTSYTDLYSDDFILPAGNLRESSRGASRADCIVVTKCPKLTESEMDGVEKRLNPKIGQDVFFSLISYGEKIMSANGAEALEFLSTKTFLLVTGIANPTPLVDYLHSKNLKFTHRSFPDHHHFSEPELKELDAQNIILTTEKDYVRLQPFLKNALLYYLPIEVSFLRDEKKFLSGVRDAIQKYN